MPTGVRVCVVNEVNGYQDLICRVWTTRLWWDRVRTTPEIVVPIVVSVPVQCLGCMKDRGVEVVNRSLVTAGGTEVQSCYVTNPVDTS